MSTFTVFHTYTPLDFITNTNLNGNILNIVTAGNAIDRTNMQLGSGIDASSFNPASGPAATFGGVVPYTFQTEVDFTGTTVTAGAVAIGGDAGGTKGLLLNVPTGSTNGFQAQVGGVTQARIASNGAFLASPLINSNAVLGPVGPGYTATGTALGATFHEVSGAVTGIGPFTITLSANAVFTSASTYAVAVNVFAPGLGSPSNIAATNLSGTQFTLPSQGFPSTRFTWTAIGT
jgi:hypothetical protein